MTERQKQYLDAFIEAGSFSGAARKIGVTRNTLRDVIRILESRGLVPWGSAAVAPKDAFTVGKTTIQYDAEGKVIQEWRRQYPKTEDFEAFVDRLCEKSAGKLSVPKWKKRKKLDKNVLFQISIFDPHVGLFADEKEVGEDYNTSIAAKRMIEAVKNLASRSNHPAEVVLVFGGDMLHSDFRSNQTEKSANNLSVDGSFQRNIKYLVATCREAVQICATIAPKVRVVIVPGNHDWHASHWLQRVLTAAYENEPAIQILDEPTSRKCIVWGDNLLVWAHGDRIRPAQWANVVATQFAQQWGVTKHRYVQLGHVHHKKAIAPITVDEQSGALVEYLEPLCPTDAWHSDQGFIGTQRGASGFEYHRENGMMTRFYYAT